jgi:hypothetical protein
VTPPPAPRNYGGDRGSSSSRGSTWSGTTSSSSGHSSSAPAPAPAPAPHSSGGGKPH